MGVIIDNIWCDVYIYIIDIKKKGKVDHCGNEVLLTLKPK